MTAILALVTGYRAWGPPEYAAVLGGPVLIYSVRAALAGYYDYRIGTNRAYIKEVSTQRRSAIDRFKAATRYGETQQLLEKYGDEKRGRDKQGDDKDEDKAREAKDAKKRAPEQRQQMPMRTNLAPPPTANIQRPPPPQLQAPAQPQPPATPHAPSSPPPTGEPAFSPTAPGASAPAQYAAPPAAPQWYDRLLDVLLGDDETKPVHRLALICTHCRLVNGQAPPGVRDLGELGRWRCAACKGWNGSVQSEVSKALGETGGEGAEGSGAKDGETEAEVAIETLDETPARGTRSRTARKAAEEDEL